MQIVYIPSESMSVQGKKDEIYKRYGKDWNIREQGGGNGNWLLTRKSDVLVDGKSYRTFVLEHYGKSKLTAKLVDKFREDVRFLYKGIIIKHNKTEPTYTKTSLFLCEKRRFFMARTEKGVVATI